MRMSNKHTCWTKLHVHQSTTRQLLPVARKMILLLCHPQLASSYYLKFVSVQHLAHLQRMQLHPTAKFLQCLQLPNRIHQRKRRELLNVIQEKNPRLERLNGQFIFVEFARKIVWKSQNSFQKKVLHVMGAPSGTTLCVLA